MKKVIHNLFLLLSIVMLCAAAYFSLSNHNKNDIFIFGYKPFIIVTGSMEPEYPVNSFVIIRQINPDEIAVGDNIAYYSEATQVYIFHRVIEVNELGLRTKGDNNDAPDLALVPFDAVVGRSVFHTTITAYLGTLFQTPARIIGYVLVPILSLNISVFAFKHAKKQKDEFEV